MNKWSENITTGGRGNDSNNTYADICQYCICLATFCIIGLLMFNTGQVVTLEVTNTRQTSYTASTSVLADISH